MNYSEEYTIGIVGLGLMGASMAMALRGFRGARIIGTDLDAQVCARAPEDGTVDEAGTDTGDVIAQSDVLMFCVYARHIPGILEAHAARLKPGCLVSDICGVKGPLYEAMLPLLSEGVRQVGAHPMAGKERGGYGNADAGLYHGCGFLITPTARSTEEDIDFMRALAGHIGAARAQVVGPAAHDAAIAYTSHLTHIAAAGLCLHPPEGVSPVFMGGGFRDCTRIADIDAGAWTELLMDNRACAADALERYIADLQAMRDALRGEDREALRALLQAAGDNKRDMLRRG